MDAMDSSQALRLVTPVDVAALMGWERRRVVRAFTDRRLPGYYVATSWFAINDEILHPGRINYLDWLFVEWPDTLSFNQMMQFMHSSGAQVSRWLQRGQLPGDRDGGNWRISKVELRRVFENGSNHLVEPTPPKPEPEPPAVRKPWLEKTLRELGLR